MQASTKPEGNDHSVRRKHQLNWKAVIAKPEEEQHTGERLKLNVVFTVGMHTVVYIYVQTEYVSSFLRL